MAWNLGIIRLITSFFIYINGSETGDPGQGEPRYESLAFFMIFLSFFGVSSNGVVQTLLFLAV